MLGGVKKEKDYHLSDPTWCKGCGIYGIFAALKKAAVTLDLDPEETVIVTGIGCHGRLNNHFNVIFVSQLTIPIPDDFPNQGYVNRDFHMEESSFCHVYANELCKRKFPQIVPKILNVCVLTSVGVLDVKDGYYKIKWKKEK